MINRFVAFFFVCASVFAIAQPPPQNVDITAPDGTRLKATYYSAGKPGPGVVLLHMCNSQRQAWEPVATQLVAAGIHAIALDYRGYGDSGGDRFKDDPQKQQQLQNEKWPGDIDAALAYLASQKGVDKTRIGAGGGSCGVNQAIQLARRHPAEVKSLVLLAGGSTIDGLTYLHDAGWLPVFASAAADDQFDSDAPGTMKWLLALNGNPRNKFVGYETGKHGTEMFGTHPDLPKQIVAWYKDTLVKSPADPKKAVARKQTTASEFWSALVAPGQAPRAAQMYRDARKRDSKAQLAPQEVVNQIAYGRMQDNPKDAIELCKLNAELYPASANAYDSLGDAYLADGQNDLALQASQKALELLPADPSNEDFKKFVRQSAEDKISKLKPAAK